MLQVVREPEGGERQVAHRVVGFGWLVRLRWMIGAAQLALIVSVALFVSPELPVWGMLAVVAFGLGSNLALSGWVRGDRPVAEGAMAAVMGLDVLLLTALLALSGGTSNPFAFLYLFQVVLAAMVLRPTWAWALVGLSAVAYGSLFLLDGPAHHHHHHHGDYEAHLLGMWVAFAVSGPFATFAVTRIRTALAEADARLAAARALQERTERLAALGTLAAGAAHELSTPLGTIAVVAGELERRAADPAVVEDARLVREEVERCRQVLLQLSADAGSGTAEADRPVKLEKLLSEVERGRVVQVEAPPGLLAREASLPGGLLIQALRRLVDNASAASPAGEPVRLAVRLQDDALELAVSDRGSGMPPEVLARAGEPFFTTRAPGEGMGLGLFFARSVAEHLGGGLRLTSVRGRGTTAVLWLGADRLLRPEGGA